MRPLFLGLGILALLVGAVWTLQGADLLPGSYMTGITFWLVAGVILLVLGAATLFLGTRSRERRGRPKRTTVRTRAR